MQVRQTKQKRIIYDALKSLDHPTATFNFGRMLFGDSYGVLATVASATGTAVKVDSV